MMKKTLSLMIVLSAALSTFSYAGPKAMDDVIKYRKGLEQSLVLNDQANIKLNAKALLTSLTGGEIVAPQEPQTYRGVPLPKNIQIKAATHKVSTTKKATPEQAAEMYRALDALAVVGYYEEQYTQGQGELAQLLKATFETAEQKTKHLRVASARYQNTLNAIAEGNSSSILFALKQSAAANVGQELSFDESTYVGQVHIVNAKPLKNFTQKDFYPAHEWIAGFYVKTPKLEQDLKDTGVPTHVIGKSSRSQKEGKKERSGGEGKDKQEPDAPPSPYQVSGYADVADRLKILKNSRFDDIIKNLRTEGKKDLPMGQKYKAIKGLTDIATEPATRNEFYHAFNALEALSSVNPELFKTFKNFNGKKSWNELRSHLLLGYAQDFFRQKTPGMTPTDFSSGTPYKYNDILYAENLDELANALLHLGSVSRDMADIQGVLATLQELNESEIGKQALSKASNGQLLEKVTHLQQRIQNIQTTRELQEYFTLRTRGEAFHYFYPSTTPPRYAVILFQVDTLDELAKGLLAFIFKKQPEPYTYVPEDLPGAIDTLREFNKKTLGKEILAQVLSENETTLEEVIRIAKKS